ncbi:gliding motility-associated C-terminal domain-containing protein [Olleya sp. Bg11-27]|uniref:T9SS type B sorting domain-containing protein n=1 Tax=Olleya sp. Bg11-27 TaxID=2058135 RepID=UPI000C316867|nr:gliding motility-associated C-terminal domain-containing protein [Olleya sp. Bg11-27]AUC74996.1 hypothetical protein CW732_04620 [Olleya sp. Bg11-27]
MKKTTFILAVLLLFIGWQANSQITTYPYTEDFEAGDGGWIADNTVAGTWALGLPADAVINSAASGANSWMTNLTGNYNISENSNVTSPVFDLSSLTAPTVSFSIWWESEFSWDGAVFQSSIDNGVTWQNVGALGDPNNWYTDGTINSSPGGQQIGWTGRDGTGSEGWVTASHLLEGLAGEANVIFRFAFSSDTSGQDDGFAFDDVSVFNTNCVNPSGIVAGGLTATSVDLSWTMGGAETSWEVVIQAPGTGMPTVAGLLATSNTLYTDNTLSPATEYEVYVRADCGSEFSIWSGPVTFTTACSVFAPDYFQDFTTIPASCWDVANNGDATTGPTDIGTSTWSNDGFLNNGTTGAYKINLYQAVRSDWLLSPIFDLTGVPYQVEFDFGVMTFASSTTAGTLGSDDTVELLITTDNGTTWTVLETFDATSVIPSNGVHVVQDLTTYSGMTAQFGIRASDGIVDDTPDNDVFVDNFQVRAIPSCADPLAIVATVTGDTTADITWDAGDTETEWQIWVQAVGTGIPTTDGVVTSLNAPYPATGLTPSTAYEVYIRGNCGTNGYSEWIGPVNFITFNTPPPAPIGVNCTSGNSTFIFTEDFGSDTDYIPTGWTGTTFVDTDGNWDITTVNSNSGGTGPNITWDGNVGTHLEYEGSGNTTNVASAISPAIDLSTALDGAELSFYMHAFGSNMGTLNVGISTSQTGPFTTAYTWIGDYQTSADEAWVPVGVNLDSYLGQVVYIEFSYVGTGDTFEADMSIDHVSVETCGDFCIAPNNITATNITSTSVDVSWTPSGAETQWNYVVQLVGTGVPTSGTTVSVSNISETVLSPNTDYEVYVQSICATGTSLWAGPFNFTTLLEFDFVLDCATGGPQSIDYCYDSNDTNVFTFTSLDGTPLNLTINAGQVENNFDEVIVLDSDGVTNLNAATPYGSDGQLAGLTFQSTGDTISFAVESDGSVSCQSSTTFASINFTVACATCVNPVATFVVVDDCANGDQFLVDVDVTSLGDATSLLIEDNQGGIPVGVSATGIQQFGPYPFNTDIIFTVSNVDDANCVITSSAIALAACPPSNDNPCNATVALVNNGEACIDINSGTLVEATDSGLPEEACSSGINDDVWYQFTALGEQQIIQILNVAGGFNVDHALYEEGVDCNDLTQLYCTTEDASVTPTLIVGNVYYIRVFSAGTTATTITFDLCIQTLGVPTYCTEAVPICSDLLEPFPNVSDSSVAPPYLDYMCLGLQPNPLWNSIYIDLAGDYTFTLEQTSLAGGLIDVDFIVWGPFPSLDGGCYELLPESIGGCSYSASPTETIELVNAPADSVYVLLITNFEGSDGTYTFTQDSGPVNGVNCDVACEVALDYDGIAIEQGVSAPEGESDTINLCGYDSVTLTASTVYDVDIIGWYVNGVYQDGLNSATLEVTESGTYQSQVSGGICDGFPTSVKTTINFYESATADQAVDMESCEDASGMGEFDLESQTATILGAQNSSDFVVTYYAALSDAQSGTGSIASPYMAIDGTTIYVRVEDVNAVGSNSGCASTNTSFNLLLQSCVFPQGISPNGDRVNDSFDLSNFNVQNIEIFNRNGRLVYSKANYTNEWEGQSDNGDMLPVGTYYYVVKYNGTEEKAAWVYINR